MPLPSDDGLDGNIDSELDKLSAIGFGNDTLATATAGRLQALSIRRLVVALDRAAAAQDRSARQMWWLTFVIFLFTAVAAVLAFIQAFAAGRSLRWW
ncbi:MAG: hypothetical protein HW416_3658 [Chloroflexi bacterium]|nr:hypothetical protein [Chloroflexota bacterium]